MKTLSQSRPAPLHPDGMTYSPATNKRPVVAGKPARLVKQRGVVLFFTLIALVVMSLAAVALIRSVDTSGMIAGNLAFKQSSMTSADAGTEAAIIWLSVTQATNNALNVAVDGTHPFNQTNAATGYYSNADPAVSLTDGSGIQWTDADSVLIGTDSAGNTSRYIIQRMCRYANQPIQTADCLFSEAKQDNNNKNVPLPQEICKGDGCPAAGQSPQIRITVRTAGPKNSLSYLQAFVY